MVALVDLGLLDEAKCFELVRQNSLAAGRAMSEMRVWARRWQRP